MEDLKIIDELLCRLKWHTNLSWIKLEESDSAISLAIKRLRDCYLLNDLPKKGITLSLAMYFDKN